MEWRNWLKNKSYAGRLADLAKSDPIVLDALLSVLKEPKGTDRYNADKVMRSISETDPGLLVPYFDEFSAMIDSDNSFLKWGAIITIANLAKVDTEKRLDGILEKYFSLIKGPSLISAGNAIGNAWKIAQNRPDLIQYIVNKIPELEKAEYFVRGKLSPECNRVAAGHALKTFDKIFAISKKKEQDAMLEFAKRYLNSSRISLAKLAKKFLKDHEK